MIVATPSTSAPADGRERAWLYLAAGGMAAAGFLARLALDPLFGASHTYTVFYPMVILAAYFLGGRPAILTTGLSVVAAYWYFDRPAFAWKTDFESIAPMCFFVFTSAVSIYFITGMRTALDALAAAQGRAEKLAASHTGLFRELNERVTNHLQLVAALLQIDARDEKDTDRSRALAEASARTLLISRVHRNLAGETDKLLDFDAFAGQLLEATLAARGRPQVSAAVEAEGVMLPFDQATSVAIVLLECLNARLQLDRPGALRVSLYGCGDEAVLRVCEEIDESVDPNLPIRPVMIDAMVEQLGGRFSLRLDHRRLVSELAFPRLGALDATAGSDGLRQTLH